MPELWGRLCRSTAERSRAAPDLQLAELSQFATSRRCAGAASTVHADARAHSPAGRRGSRFRLRSGRFPESSWRGRISMRRRGVRAVHDSRGSQSCRRTGANSRGDIALRRSLRCHPHVGRSSAPARPGRDSSRSRASASTVRNVPVRRAAGKQCQPGMVDRILSQEGPQGDAR